MSKRFVALAILIAAILCVQGWSLAQQAQPPEKRPDAERGRFSPDGKAIVPLPRFSPDGKVLTPRVEFSPDGKATVPAPRYSPDGKVLTPGKGGEQPKKDGKDKGETGNPN